MILSTKYRFPCFAKTMISIMMVSLLASCSSVGTTTPEATLPPPTPTVMPTVMTTSTVVPPGDNGDGIIAFDSDGDIYLMDVKTILETGNDNRSLVIENAFGAAWSPDGTQIAFASTRGGEKWGIFVVNADGSEVRQVTEAVLGGISPNWSPDGTQIAFVADQDIYIINADGSNLQRLTHDSAMDGHPDWSPDGTRIVFTSDFSGNPDIYVLDFTEGGEPVNLTQNNAVDAAPDWSPDGSQITFYSDRNSGRESIFIMDSDGNNIVQLTNSATGDWHPVWSPDGTQIAFVSYRNYSSGDADIYVMNLSDGPESEGNHPLRLTHSPTHDENPAWRPTNTTARRTKTWIKKFEGPDYGAFFDIVLTSDENMLAVGTTNHLHFPPYSGDALFMKFTQEGDVLWEQTWGGDGYEQAWAVTPAENGGYYIFGETDSYGAGDRDFFLLKITDDGSEEWFKTYGYAYREWLYGMLQLSNGDLLIYGFTESVTSRQRNQYVLRLGKNGNVIWEYTVESPGEELVADALETAEGNLVFAVIVGEDGKLMELDSDGNLQWEKRYKLPGWQFASQVSQTEDGGYLLAGFSMGSNRQADTWLARCNSIGEMDWETSFGNPAFDDYANSMIQLKDGTYLIGGLGNGMLLTHIDETGNILWERSLVGTAVYGARGLIQLEDGGFLVAGFIQISNGRSYDAIVLRTNAEGQVDE